MRPEAQDPSYRWRAGPEIQEHKSGTRDLGPVIHLIDGAQDQRSGTLKVGPETRDPYNNNKISIHGTEDPRLQNLKVDFQKTFLAFSEA